MNHMIIQVRQGPGHAPVIELHATAYDICCSSSCMAFSVVSMVSAPCLLTGTFCYNARLLDTLTEPGGRYIGGRKGGREEERVGGREGEMEEERVDRREGGRVEGREKGVVVSTILSMRI